jgi:hypothetical protein
MAILAQPLTRALIIGARVRDQAPEMARVIETPQMHQLVNEHVVAHRVRHQHKTPVETDVTGRGARSPTRALIPYADARHCQPMLRGKVPQSLWQLAGGLPAEFTDGFWRIAGAVRSAFADLRPLPLDPRLLLFGEQRGIPAGSPSRDGDTDTSVRPYPYDISPSGRMADEIHERITIVLRHES